MNYYVLMDAISYLDVKLIEKHLEKKEKIKVKMRTKKRNRIVWWSAFAACLALVVCSIPIIDSLFDGSHGTAPISIQYADMKEVHKQLGFDTLYSDINLDIATTNSISVSYQDNGEGNAVLTEPIQLLLRQTYNNGTSAPIYASFYILFGKSDIEESYIGGYEEQGLTKEINGITVHYSEIFDGDNHTQAKFFYDGNLYVVDIVSSGQINLDYYLNIVFDEKR